jgi:hypothetical protein
MVTKEYFHKYFEYQEGYLYLKEKLSPTAWEGKKVGKPRPDGYCVVHLHNKKYYIHRIIFMYYIILFLLELRM